MALVVLVSILVPVGIDIAHQQPYKLDANTIKLVGSVNPNLANKFSYDADKKSWQFNKAGIPVDQSLMAKDPAAALQAKVGGEGKQDTSLYSVTLPAVGEQGITYYDVNTQLSFTMKPDFKVGSGQEHAGQLIYPLQHGAKLVYSAKSNGMKEDIVLSKDIGDRLSYGYDLQLPSTLRAAVQADGSIGIFSPDPALFGEVSYGSDTDKAKIDSARQHAAKDHLLFAIPAPVVKDNGGGAGKASARFSINGPRLTVTATGMDSVRYPATIDPSVVVTSSSDFASGNSDGGIDYPAGQISSNSLTGGSFGAWASTGSGLTARFASGNFVYNGYLYALGGINGSPLSTTMYAPINATDGTVGTWTATTNLPTARGYGLAATYNGYAYLYSGYTSGTSALSDVIYAPINSDGTLGSWTTASNAMNTAVCRAGGVIYNGYIYALGGVTGAINSNCGNGTTTPINTTQYAQIMANGDVGAWTTSAVNFTSARMSAGVAAYNGFLYISMGTSNGTTTYKDTQYARILANGDIASWSTSALQPPNTDYRLGFTSYDGYLYMSGGTNSLTITYTAQIKTNGDIGRWSRTNDMSTGRYGQLFVAYNGYVYYAGGQNATNGTLNDTGFAKIDPPGGVQPFTTNASLFATGVRGLKSVGYNGYIYAMGGDAGSAPVVTTYRSALNNTNLGSSGNFASGQALPVGLTYLSAVAYNGYMYVVGGCTSAYASCTTASNNVATVYSSPISTTDGSLGSWTAQTSISGARYGASLVAYNDQLYIIGGLNGATFQTDIQYHAVGTNGTISGSWTTSARSLPAGRAYFGAAVYAGMLYVAGGCTAGALICTSSLSDLQYAALTSGGDLAAAFTANSTSFSNARGGVELSIISGYVYIYGGWDGTTYYADTQFAPLQTSGAAGAWTASVNMAAAKTGFSGFAYNNALIILGGYDGTSYTNNVQSALVNNGGSGAVSVWAGTTSFTTGRTQHASIANKGYVYVVGGYDGSSSTYYSDVQYAAINDDGTVGSWQTTSSLPATRANASLQVSGDYMYILGGSNGSTSAATYYAYINKDGSLSSWQSTTTLPQVRSDFGSFVKNGYIFIAGGISGGTVLTSVYSAPLSCSGGIGTWTATTSLATGRYDLGVVTNGTYAYALGGMNASSAFTDGVQYAVVNSDGTLGSWNTTTSFNLPRGYLEPVVANGYIYIFGGYDGTNSYNTAESAPLNANGTIGNWQATQTYNTKRFGDKVVYYQGTIILTGGYDGTTYLATTTSTKLNSIPRIGHYSKLVDFGGSYALSSIYYHGTITNGLYNIMYRTADASGQLGSIKRASALGGPALCSANGTRYVYLLITLDNSANVSFPDSASSSNTLTDLTVNYVPSRATPNARLHNGKFFADEALQSLDICGS